jgi:hypothetical protein
VRERDSGLGQRAASVSRAASEGQHRPSGASTDG